MDSIISALGLGEGTPNRVPYYVFANFIFAYAVLSTRGAKLRAGIDHNVSPRGDLQKYGERAVQEGKLTRKKLESLKRQESAHANAVENFPLLAAALLSAQAAGVPTEVINRAAFTYTLARTAYAISYIVVETRAYSWTRSVAWWVGNISCLRLLWKAGQLYQKSA